MGSVRRAAVVALLFAGAGCTDDTVELLRVPGAGGTTPPAGGRCAEVDPIRISSIAELDEDLVPYGLVPIADGYLVAWADDAPTDTPTVYGGVLDDRGEYRGDLVPMGETEFAPGAIVPGPLGATVAFRTPSGATRVRLLTAEGVSVPQIDLDLGPRFALAPAATGFAVASVRADAAGRALFLQFVDGPAFGEVRVGLAAPDGAPPQLVWDGARFAVLYARPGDRPEGETVVQVLDGDGAPIGAPTPITGAPLAHPPTLAADGRGFLVKWDERGGRGAWQWLDLDGAPVGTPQLAPRGEAAAAWSGEVYGLATTEVGAPLDLSLVPGSATRGPLERWAEIRDDSTEAPRLVWDGAGFAMIWKQRHPGVAGRSIFFARICP